VWAASFQGIEEVSRGKCSRVPFSTGKGAFSGKKGPRWGGGALKARVRGGDLGGEKKPPWGRALNLLAKGESEKSNDTGELGREFRLAKGGRSPRNSLGGK